jgi:hypothetical protein
MLLTRRNLIQFGVAIAPWNVVRSFAASDFWNTKNPDSWTQDEIAKLLKKSPWAKEVTGERTSSNKSSSTSTDPNLSSSNPTGRSRNPNSLGMPRGSSSSTRAPKPPSSKTVTTYKGIVIWESAKVIRDAEKTPLPEGFDGQYVLSVTGIPLAKTSSKSSLDTVRQVTMLQIKGRDPLEAGVVQQNKDHGAIYYMGFSKEALAIGKDDKDVVFTTHMGKVSFTAKFNPKEMLYHGELAV